MPEKIKVVLVDDEKDSREVMAGLLHRYFPEVTVVVEFTGFYSLANAYPIIKHYYI